MEYGLDGNGPYCSPFTLFLCAVAHIRGGEQGVSAGCSFGLTSPLPRSKNGTINIIVIHRQCFSGINYRSEKKSTFQTITLNESLAAEHHKEYHGNSSEDGDKNKPLSREAKTQIKMEKRVYYKSIRSKPKGKKAGEMNSASAKIDKISPWRHSEWDATDGVEGSDYY
jgi:hypothetical protein